MTPVDPGDERIAVWRKFDDWKARRILHFVESTRGGEAAFAVIHCKANIGPRLVTFFAGNRPNDIGAVIGAESYFGSVLFALDRFFDAVYPFGCSTKFCHCQTMRPVMLRAAARAPSCRIE